MTPDDLPELLTVEEAATLLRVTVDALRIRMSRGQVPGVVRLFGGTSVRIRRDELRAALGLKKEQS